MQICLLTPSVLQFLAAFTADFVAVGSGMHYGWSSAAVPKLLQNDSYIPVTQEEASWITTTLLFGNISGAIITGILLDKLGRKATLLISSCPLFISWLLIAFSPNVYLLLIGRFIAGVGDGLLQCSLPVYIGEIANPKVRGVFGSAISVLWFSGMLLSNVIGSLLSIKSAALISAAIPLSFFIVFVWMPESPIYLVRKGKMKEAESSIRALSGESDVAVQINRIQDNINQNAKSGGYIDILTSSINRKVLCLMLSLRTIQQFCGVTSIMFYAQIIIQQSSGDTFSPQLSSTIYFGMYVVFLMVCSALVDRLGRKPLLVFSIVGSGLALLIDGVYLAIQAVSLPWIPVATIIAYAIFFSSGMQSIPILMQGEMFPANIKAKAVSIYVAHTSIASTLVFKIFQVTNENFGLHVPLFLFMASCFVGLPFILYVVPETKGKTLEEIQEELGVVKEKQSNKQPLEHSTNKSSL